MATVVLGLLNHTELDDADTLTNWSGPDTLDADFAKEGDYAVTGPLRADADEWYTDYGSAPVTAAGKHLRMWVNTINKAYMEPESSGGYEVYCYDGSSSQYITFMGSDTYDGGWVNLVIDMTLFTSLTLANVQRWGIRAQHTATAKNIDNTWIDYVRYLDGYYFTGGTNGDEVDLALIAARDVDDGASTARGYGIVSVVDGVYFCYGKLTIGNSTTTTYFLMDGDVLSFSDQSVAADFYEISADGTVAVIVIQNSVIQAAGTSDDTRFVFDFSNTSVTATVTGTVFKRGAAITFASGQTATGNTFNDCSQITHGGADMSDCVIQGYEGTADTAALVYNVNADPDGEMDNMAITKGTASTHAIEFGSTCPTSMTLRGIAFSGYNASDAQTDSTLYFSSTGSQAYTVNLVGCTGNISYKTHLSFTGSVTLVTDPVTILVTVQDENLDPIENAQTSVFLLDSPYTELMNEDTTALGEASESYSGSTPVDVVVKVRKSDDLDDPRYFAYSQIQEVSTSGLTLTVTLKENPFL